MRIGTEEMLQLWVRYMAFRSKTLAKSTVKRDLGKIEKRLLKMPVLADEIAIRDWLMHHYASDTARRTLEQLSACCKWAVRSRYLKSNPFDGLAQDFRKSVEGDRRSFPVEERDAIIQSFESDFFSDPASHYPHSYYAGFIKLLFYTGCRLEEGRALLWTDIPKDLSYIHFHHATPSDTNIEGDTKTHRTRRFPCNERLQNLLKSARPGASGLVFPSPKGCAIDTHNLLNRGWSDVVLGLVESGQVREYLPLKNTRHTFITLALEAGMEVKDVAYLVGNRPEVIYKHYASVKRDLKVPEF